jgi:hypothetical protein
VIALHRVADQPDQPGLEIGQTADIVQHGKIGDIVVQGVNGEIAPPGIVLDPAVDVVTENAAIRRPFDRGAIAILVVIAVTAKGSDFNEF